MLPECGRGWKLGRPVETNVSLSGVSLGAAHRVPAHHGPHLAPGLGFEVGKLQIRANVTFCQHQSLHNLSHSRYTTRKRGGISVKTSVTTMTTCLAFIDK